MSKFSLSARRAGLALAIAGALGAGAGLSLRLLEPARSAPAATDHAAMGPGGGPSAARPAAAASDQVVIRDFDFGPKALTVAVGTKVIWTNRDDDPHTVTSEADPKLFSSPPLDTGDAFAFTFDKPGTYRYFCSIHPHMQGTIVVK